MALIISVIQAVSGLVAAFVAYYFSRLKRPNMVSILGILSGIPVGLISGVIAIVLMGLLGVTFETDFLIRSLISTVWFSIFGCVGGAIYGRRRYRTGIDAVSTQLSVDTAKDTTSPFLTDRTNIKHNLQKTLHWVLLCGLSIVVGFSMSLIGGSNHVRFTLVIAEIFGMALGLLIMTLLVIAVPTAIYWLIKKALVPGFFVITWIAWTVLAFSTLYGTYAISMN